MHCTQKPRFEPLQVLNIDEIYKLEVAKVNLNKLPVFCGNQLTICWTLSSIPMYSTRNASSKKFYVLRRSLVTINHQPLKISGIKIWNSLPRHIRDKILTFRKSIVKDTNALLFAILRGHYSAGPSVCLFSFSFFPLFFHFFDFFLITKINSKFLFRLGILQLNFVLFLRGGADSATVAAWQSNVLILVVCCFSPG